jgi:hypothetical protein
MTLAKPGDIVTLIISSDIFTLKTSGDILTLIISDESSSKYLVISSR